MARDGLRPSPSDRKPGNALSELGTLLHDVASRILDPYRPELHYMRGPGPKWRAKHVPGGRDAGSHPMPALVRVRMKA
jgi:hypothetical protein